MKKILQLFFILGFLFNTTNAQTTYYVSQSGNNSNSGTSTSSPWKTISKVNNASLPSGTVVAFKSGDVFNDEPLETKTGVTYKSYGSGKAVLGSTSSTLEETIRISNDNVTIDNLKIYGSSLTTKRTVYPNIRTAVLISSADGTIIKNCTLIGGDGSRETSSHSLIYILYNSDNTLIEHNEMYYAYAGIDGNDPKHVEISYNKIHSIFYYHGRSSSGGICIHFYGDTNGDSYNANYEHLWIHHNELYDYEHSAIDINTISKYIVEYNDIHNNLDDRIYFGVVQHGTMGKMFDNTGKTTGSVGGVIRYNIIHDIYHYGEAGKYYYRPSPSDMDAGTGINWLSSTSVNPNYRTDKPLYEGAANTTDPDSFGPNPLAVHGRDSWDHPDALIGGSGYANIWIHNNIFYNTDVRVFSRGYSKSSTGAIVSFRSDLPSYFVNNTTYKVCEPLNGDNTEWWAQGYGVVRITQNCQSPNYIYNNIIDYQHSNQRSGMHIVEEKTYLTKNIFTNKTGEYSGDSPPPNTAIWYQSQGENLENSSQHYYNTSPGWVNINTNANIITVGVNGTEIPDLRITTNSSAYDNGKAYLIDPTGRNLGYDILGNLRTSNDIGALESVVIGPTADFTIPSLPYTHTYNNISASNDWDVGGDYAEENGSDIAYKLVLTNPATIDVTLCSSSTDFDTMLEIFNEDGTTTGQFNDDDCGLQSALYDVSLAAGTYFIVVDGYDAEVGDYKIKVEYSADYIIDIASLPYTHIGSNANSSDNWNVQGGPDGQDITYKIVLDEETFLSISTCSENTNFDTKLEIFNADGTTTGYYNDDTDDYCDYDDLSSFIGPDVMDNALQSGTYFIVVDGFAGETGDYEITVTSSSLSKKVLTAQNENDKKQYRLLADPAQILAAFDYAAKKQNSIVIFSNRNIFTDKNLKQMVVDNADSFILTLEKELNGNKPLPKKYFKASPPVDRKQIEEYAREKRRKQKEGKRGKKLLLNPAYPDPTNPSTTISYYLPENTAVTVKIYNSIGSLVKTLVEGTQQRGDHSLLWNGKNNNGNQIASGLYFIRFSALNKNITQKIMLLK